MRLLPVIALLFSFTVHAEPALERGTDETIKLRGQGPNPWSYAFAEEQFLKDQACLPKGCPANGNQWNASIFDLVKAHAQASREHTVKLHDKDGQKITGSKLLFAGSREYLPFEKTNVTAVRASKCTLEQPLFRMNRSFGLNQSRMGIYDQLSDIHKKIKAGGVNSVFDAEQKGELKNLQIQALFGILETIAKSSEDAEAFVTKVIEFTSCPDRVEIPKLEVEGKIVTNEAAIRAELSELLKNKRPVMLGVCSEILEDDKSTASCSGHIVVAKDIKAGKVLIVDSGFFSDGKKNPDGSIMISIDTLAKAAAKHGAHLERDQRENGDSVLRTQHEFDAKTARLKKELENSLAGLAAQGGTLDESSKETMANLRKKLARVAPAKFKSSVISILSEVADGDEDDVDEDLLAEIEKLELNTLADLSKVEPLILASLKRNASEAIEDMRRNMGGEYQLAWPALEPSVNMVWVK